jgi:uncharacterized membrane protein
MVSNSILRLFLMMSILVIMTGILLIVYMQFDRGYVFIGFDSEYEKEQQNLISHVYQNQLDAKQAPAKPVALQPTKTVMIVEPEPQIETRAPVEPVSPPVAIAPPAPIAPPTVSSQPRTLAQATPADDVWNNQAADDYYSQLMRHNPWSPYYKPGQQ